ncbi:hypothetical protein JK364_51545 [Streptomyces sp. 110]|uniref:LysR substrate-binding domain-containing protein n=1 Tax=Streptomyces endocoffeicus TaxID=2898945 RepID=A0ABS1Q7W0_9ACTN|nr:LysR substrate-binding domain-containing protein [Streptomyces endocoffeicus]MBL1120644.1 hypothetical protein [Streptomyces endocoffeicus]
MDCGRADVLLGLPHSGRCLERLVQSVVIRPRVRHRSTGFETVRAMVAGGMAWSVLNQRPVHSMTYDGGEVVTLELEEPFEPLPLVLASMKGVRLTRRAQAFIRSAGRAVRLAG